MENNRPSTVICIVGPPGGGATLLAKAVQAAGVSLGEPESWLPPFPGIPLETYENGVITDTHLRLLKMLQLDVFSSAPLPDGWESGPEAAAIRQDLQTMLSWSPFPQPEWGWKNPAGARLLPLWESLAAESGFQLRLVIAVRQPLEMACSLRRVARLPLPQGMRLWTTTMLSILESADRLPHLFCSYDRFLADPESEARRLLDFLGREKTPARVAAVAATADAKLCHIEKLPEEDLREVGGALIDTLYNGIRQRCSDQPPAPSPLSLATWQKCADLFQFAKMDVDPRITVCAIRFDTGSGFSAAPDYTELLPANPENRFDIRVQIPQGTRKIGFTPGEGLAFRCRLKTIESAAGPHAVFRSNARLKEAGWDIFPPTEIPLYEIGGPFDNAGAIHLCGDLVIQSIAGEIQ